MTRLVFYIAGAIGVFLTLGIAASTNLLVVVIGLSIWAVGFYYCVGAAIDRIRNEQLQSSIRSILLLAFIWPLAAVYAWGVGVLEGLGSNTPRRDHLGQRLEVAGFIALGLLLFSLGIMILSTTLPASKIAALVFGPVLLGIAWLLLQRYQARHATWVRRSPPGRFSEGGHGAEVLSYLLGIPGLAFAGVLILYYAF